MGLVEELVTKYGEEHRDLIVSALHYLDATEPVWNLLIPINRRTYIECLVNRRTIDKI
jgi:hypothetical protein